MCHFLLFPTIIAIGHLNDNYLVKSAMKIICAAVEIMVVEVPTLPLLTPQEFQISHKKKFNLHEDSTMCAPLIDLSLIQMILFVCLVRTYLNVFILCFHFTNSVFACKYCKLSYCCYCVYDAAGMERRTVPHHLYISKEQAFC